jgi:hypothetical protein
MHGSVIAQALFPHRDGLQARQQGGEPIRQSRFDDVSGFLAQLFAPASEGLVGVHGFILSVG